MRRHIFCLLLLLLTLPSIAKAETALQHIPPGGTLRGNFVQQHYFLNADAKPLTTSGTFVVAPDYGLLWNVQNPAPLSFVVTPNGMDQNFGTFKLLHVTTAHMPFLAEATQMVSNALSGNWEILKNDFMIQQQKDAKGWRTTLTPRPGKKLPFKLLVAKGEKFVDAVKITRPDDGIDVISFSGQAMSGQPPSVAETAIFAQVQP